MWNTRFSNLSRKTSDNREANPVGCLCMPRQSHAFFSASGDITLLLNNSVSVKMCGEPSCRLFCELLHNSVRCLGVSRQGYGSFLTSGGITFILNSSVSVKKWGEPCYRLVCELLHLKAFLVQILFLQPKYETTLVLKSAVSVRRCGEAGCILFV